MPRDTAVPETLFEDPPGEVRQLPVRTNAPAAVLDPANPMTWGKVPRNSACPCGSGKKYKHCHGKVA